MLRQQHTSEGHGNREHKGSHGISSSPDLMHLAHQHVVMNGICGFYNTYVTSIALNRTGWHYYIVFVGLNVVYGKSSPLSKRHFDRLNLASQVSSGSSLALKHEVGR